MADAWRDLVRAFDGVDPPLDLLRRAREREAGLQTTGRRGWPVPHVAGWALAAAGVVVVAAALALAAHSRRDQPAGTPATVVSPAKDDARIIDDPRMVITGGTRAQRRLLRSIVRGIDSNDVPKVEIGSPPPPYNAKGRSWLTFRLSGLHNRSQLGIWETWLAAGAFRELSRSHGLPNVYGFGQSFADSIPGGHNASLFHLDASQPTSGVDAETLTSTIKRNLANADLSLVSLRFARPFNLAPIVIARTDDPNAGRDGWRPKGYPIADDSQLEGSFFEVVDGSGNRVFFVAHSTRTQMGMSSGALVSDFGVFG
jgi:hypothetical protein